MIRLALLGSVVMTALSVVLPTAPTALDCGPVSEYAERSQLDSSLVALFEGGQAFPDFLDAARRRREGWLSINAGVGIADSSVARARAVGGEWRLLVVAIDACGDSMQQVPYVARLADLVDGLSVRIVPPTEGAHVQAAHRSMDGRTATPTFVLIDSTGADMGCIVELPREIRHWTHARRDSMSSDALHEYRREWYAEDKGASIVQEVVELMEQAKSGAPLCERGA